MSETGFQVEERDGEIIVMQAEPRIPQPDLVRRVRNRRPAKMVGDAEGHVVRPHIGLERAAAVEIGIVGGKAQLIVSEHRKPRPEMVFDPDQALHGHAVKLILESARIGRPRCSANLMTQGTFEILIELVRRCPR